MTEATTIDAGLTAVINDIRENIDALRTNDASFITSVIATVRKYQRISPKQRACIDKMHGYILNGYPQPTTTKLAGGVVRIYEMLNTAKSNKVRYPKITLDSDTLETARGQLRISLAGPRSRYVGQAMLTDGGPYGENEWYGTIDEQGNWTESRQVTDAVRQTVEALARDPEITLMAHGHNTGHCGCCNRPLTDERSLAAGVGPVCAAKYGLDWGKIEDAQGEFHNMARAQRQISRAAQRELDV